MYQKTNIKLLDVHMQFTDSGRTGVWTASAQLDEFSPVVHLSGTIDRADNDAPWYVAESLDGCYFGGIESDPRDAVGAVFEQYMLH